MVERSPEDELPSGYRLRQGSTLDRALLIKFMHRTYQELATSHEQPHLVQTVEQYFAPETPLWWIEPVQGDATAATTVGFPSSPKVTPVACLWLGTAIDQRQGDRHAHIFLLYVAPTHRRRGIGTALMRQAEGWAKARGDRQIGLQVFQSNQAALSLYQQLGYQTQSLWLVKSLS
jgi:ribosomal protein S18 acetylase RimI-like enzyme